MFDFLTKFFVIVATTITGFVSSISGTPNVQVTPVAQQEIVSTIAPITSIIQNPPHEVYSEYRYKDWQVNVKALIPYDAGNVTGSLIVRDIQSAITRCTGDITGSYDGKEGGQVYGEIHGSCKLSFLTGEFNATDTGKVYRKKGEIPLDFTVKAVGFEESGNITLHFTPFERTQ